MRRRPLRGLTALAVLALLAACSSGGGLRTTGTVTATGPAADQQARIGMTDRLQFRPNVVRAAVGTLTLVVTNEGLVPHDLVFRDPGLGQLSRVDGGRTSRLRVVFTTPGTYRFRCTFHPGMDGQVVVTEKRP